MRFLLVSQWCTPEPDGRVSTLAAQLVRQGHEVDVVTAFPHYPIGRLYDGYRLRWRQREVINGVNILRLPIYPDHSRSAVKRSINYLSFQASLLGMGPFLLRRPDVIWGYTPLVGVAAMAFARLFRVPKVLEIADIWPEALSASGMLSEGLLTRTVGALSNWIYRSMDALIVLNPGFKENLARRGVPESRIHVIENWADTDIYRPVPYDAELAAKCGIAGKFNIVFAGNMGFAQGLDTVVEAADLLSGTPDIQFVFIGDGAYHANVVEQVKRRGLANVRFLGRRHEREMAAYYAISDALLVHLRDTPLFAITIPAKTQAYMACAKPIIMGVRGDGARLVEAARCGIAVPPEDPRALADAVMAMYRMDPAKRKAMGEAGYAEFVRRFTKPVLMERMVNVLLDVAKAGVKGHPK